MIDERERDDELDQSPTAGGGVAERPSDEASEASDASGASGATVLEAAAAWPVADEAEPVEPPDAAADVVVESIDAEEPTAPRAPASTAWIAWTVAITFAVIAVFSTLQWRAVAGPAADVDAALTAATEYVLTLSTWDASEGLEDTYIELLARATDEFRSEIDTVFGPQTRAELVDLDATSQGVVLERYVGELEAGDPDSVRAVVVVEQLVLTGPTADPSLRSERVASVRMVRADGGWLVDDLELLSELELTEETAG